MSVSLNLKIIEVSITDYLFFSVLLLTQSNTYKFKGGGKGGVFPLSNFETPYFAQKLGRSWSVVKHSNKQ